MAILLSVFNGERFIEELLCSLGGQTYPNVTVFARDDGSRDRSRQLLETAAGAGKLVLLESPGNLGATRSFFEIVRHVRADIYMFCDQDDVWLPEKVATAVDELRSVGLERPVLYHCDLRLVDENLREIHPSFHAHEGIRMPDAQRLKCMVVQNCVVGCTMAFTESLVFAAGLRIRVPEGCAMHDWWLALCANTMGTIIYDERRHILYRQHGSNVSGASRRTLRQKCVHQFSRAGVERINRYRCRVGRQAEAFLAAHDRDLAAECRPIFRAAGSLLAGAGLKGWVRCAMRGVKLQNTYMNLAMAYSSLASIWMRATPPSSR